MDIVDLLLSRNTSDDPSAYVATLINEHHQDSCKLYPDKSIIPKMYFMVHIPGQINDSVSTNIVEKALRMFFYKGMGVWYVTGQFVLKLNIHILNV